MTCCCYCDKPVVGPGVVDGFSTYCNDDCHERAAERYWLNAWATR